MSRKIWEGWIKWNKNKVQGRMSRCWETKLSLISNHVQSDNEDVIGASWSYFLLPLHMSTILYLLILYIPTYGLFSWSLALKGKQSLEEVRSLKILVSIVLAIPIDPLYMLYETYGRWEFYKNWLG
jgi:hypothetical protein